MPGTALETRFPDRTKQRLCFSGTHMPVRKNSVINNSLLGYGPRKMGFLNYVAWAGWLVGFHSRKQTKKKVEYAML